MPERIAYLKLFLRIPPAGGQVETLLGRKGFCLSNLGGVQIPQLHVEPFLFLVFFSGK